MILILIYLQVNTNIPLPRFQHTFKDDSAFYFNTELIPSVTMSQLPTAELLELVCRHPQGAPIRHTRSAKLDAAVCDQPNAQPYWKRKGPSAPLGGEEDDRGRCRERLLANFEEVKMEHLQSLKES